MNKVIKILAIVCVVAGLVCGGVAAYRYMQEKNAGAEYDKLRETVTAEQSEPEETSEAPASSDIEEPEEETVPCPVDFTELQSENSDIYAWIQIPGTKIDYPILQRTGDDAYYLTHTYTGKKKKEGAIYTESLNSLDFSDPNTVIYGHNMKNGSMFRQLHEYEDRAFFEEYPDVYIYTPEKRYHYQIFAAYKSDDSHILKSYDFSDANIFSKYLQEILAKRSNMSNNIRSDVHLGEDSKIITLSTCTGNVSKRYLVQAVLTDTYAIREEK